MRVDAGSANALLDHCLEAARQLLFVRCYLETISQMQAALEFYVRNGFRELESPLGRTGHVHNDRWLARPLRASAREMDDGASARKWDGSSARDVLIRRATC